MTVDDAIPAQAQPLAESKITPHVSLTIIGALSVALLIWLADWLFYDQTMGVSLSIFLVAIAAASFATRQGNLTIRQLAIVLMVLLVGLIPSAVQPSLIATVFGFVTTAYFAISMSRADHPWTRRLGDSLRLLRDMTWRAPVELNENVRLRARRPRWSMFIGWIVPLGFCAAFVLLLSSANPLIEELMPRFDTSGILANINVPRLVLWLLFGCLVWPFVFERTRRASTGNERKTQALSPAATLQTLPHGLLDDTAILRSLVLFNALFAVETMLDLIYLWGGVNLPNGTGYASYAHRGAYPLIATALLAAFFVLIAFRPGTTAHQSRFIKILLFAFVGQNIFLVLSSILRLDLYVEVYSLTYWRLAAGIWMGLVAIGLVLIILRIALDRSNTWLIGANVTALAATLYAVSLINLPALISEYNVSHSREMSLQGQQLDVPFLFSMGPQAIPAIDHFLNRNAPDRSDTASQLLKYRNYYVDKHMPQNWRAWSWYDARLAHYLNRPPPAVPPPLL